jgi:hypothetical protein
VEPDHQEGWSLCGLKARPSSRLQRPGFVLAFFLRLFCYKREFAQTGTGAGKVSMIRSNKDFWAGVIYIFFGASAIVIARDYPMGTAIRMGPAYFPSLLGGILSVIGALSVIRSFLVSGTPIEILAFKSLALIVAAVLLFGFVVKELGLAIALPLLVLISGSGSVYFRWWPMLALALGITLFCILIFVKALGIPLPIWGTWLGF